ncbi:TPA: hypothetical protein RTG66_001568 [Campylobacter jejuni]|nr:hypothetical protein [Campylobacter jejuni]
MTIEDIKEAFASQGDKLDFPYEIDPDGFMSWLQGYGIDYQKTPEEGNKFIERLPFNMLMFLITSYMIDIKNKMATGIDLDKKLDKTEYEADKSFFVTTNTNQAINSLKTFNVTPQAINNPVNANDLVRLAYLSASGGVGLGFNQKWQDLTTQRKFNVYYTNNTGKPIYINVSIFYDLAASDIFNLLEVDGKNVKFRRLRTGASGHGYNNTCNLSLIIPNNVRYKMIQNFQVVSWLELR